MSQSFPCIRPVMRVDDSDAYKRATAVISRPHRKPMYGIPSACHHEFGMKLWADSGFLQDSSVAADRSS